MLSDILRAKRSTLVAERDQLLEGMTPEAFTPEVEARANDLIHTLTELDANIEQALEAEKREAAAAPTRVQVGAEPNPVYRKDSTEHSYFRDLFTANVQNDMVARERLTSAQARTSNGIVSTGNTFAPPAWLVSDFVEYARPARVAASLVQQEVLPGGVSSINFPAISGGASVGVQATQNTAVSETDLVVTSVSSGITTIAGQQKVSLQLLKQSGIPFDRVLLQDMARAYAAQLDAQVLNGSGQSGQLYGLTNGTGVTYTSSAPAVYDGTTSANSFYHIVNKAITAVRTTRYADPDAILMHPRRWSWILSAGDTTNRPLVVPNGPAFNQVGTADAMAPAGFAGTFAGVKVYLDANIATTVATDQDQVFVIKSDDNWLFESAVETASFEATYANTGTVLFRTIGFAAFVQRYAASVQVIGGTGLAL